MRPDFLLIDGFLDAGTASRWASAPLEPLPGRHDTSAMRLMARHEMVALADRVGRELARHFAITEPLFCDYAAACRSLPGMSHVEHADAETLSGGPSHTPWRTVTAMLYLNTQGIDFTGGALVFTRLGMTVTPRAGRLVGFRCDGAHAHAVPPVVTGVRRALAFWFTTSPKWAGTLNAQA